jgi:hypothetical protein
MKGCPGLHDGGGPRGWQAGAAWSCRLNAGNRNPFRTDIHQRVHNSGTAIAPSALVTAMRYFFDFIDGVNLIDVHGIDLPNYEAAIAEARLRAKSHREAQTRKSALNLGNIRIRDIKDRVVATIPIKEKVPVSDK